MRLLYSFLMMALLSILLLATTQNAGSGYRSEEKGKKEAAEAQTAAQAEEMTAAYYPYQAGVNLFGVLALYRSVGYGFKKTTPYKGTTIREYATLHKSVTLHEDSANPEESVPHEDAALEDDGSLHEEAVPLEQVPDNRYEALRNEMVERQIIARGIRDRATLQAMRKVPRHEFVPPVQRRNAYMDTPLPIGHGQTISQPYIVAFMTELLQLDSEKTALEIGTGSGYQAAVLAEITDQVYTIEIIEELGEWGKGNLRRSGYEKVRVKFADGYHGWEDYAPYDAIVVTAAADHIPPPLVEQLADGGRMVIPVGSPFQTQQLMLVEKQGEDIRTRNLMPVRFVPFTRN